MRKQFPDPLRFGLWKAWSGKCVWCSEPVVFKDIQIDHLIPLDAVSIEEDRVRIIAFYSLAPGFDFSELENCIPSCARCNRRKSNAIFIPSPALVLLLASVGLHAKLARETAAAITADEKKSRVLVKVANALEMGHVTEEDITELFVGLPELKKKSFDLEEESPLHVAPGWEVVGRSDKLLTVRSPDGRFGETSTSSDPSWLCPRCLQKGPWQGIICLTCGMRSDPSY
jgi:hypothetical protein